jgi:cytochrome c oxidase subunit 4
MRERGVRPFSIEDGVPPARASEHVHFEGRTQLFLSVLGGLLVLTLVEVFLAYIHLPLTLMLVILMGLSLVKAAMIVAYFMHLKFERMSLVLTLIPTVVICICLLFIVFPDSFRANDLRTTRPTGAAPAEAPAHEESH